MRAHVERVAHKPPLTDALVRGRRELTDEFNALEEEMAEAEAPPGSPRRLRRGAQFRQMEEAGPSQQVEVAIVGVPAGEGLTCRCRKCGGWKKAKASKCGEPCVGFDDTIWSDSD